MTSFPVARVAPEKADFRPVLPPGFLPGVNGTHMGKMTYGEQLAHPNWQRKRLEMLDAAGWTCTSCDAEDVTLHVHHKRYVKGRLAWEYENDELAVLCKNCHAAEHALQSQVYEELATYFDGDMDVIAALLLGMRNAILLEHNPPDPSWADGALPAGDKAALMVAFTAGNVCRLLVDQQDEGFTAALHVALWEHPEKVKAAVAEIFREGRTVA